MNYSDQILLVAVLSMQKHGLTLQEIAKDLDESLERIHKVVLLWLFTGWEEIGYVRT